jgi:hypothetical protein
MPNLFPTVPVTVDTAQTQAKTQRQGKSWRFDFTKGDFVLSPTGRVVESEGLTAWLEWCYKALQTPRYRYMIYSTDYGQELEALIPLNLPREANESEIKRMITECLMVNPFTKSVGDFSFTWKSDEVNVAFTVTNVFNENTTLTLPLGVS